MTLGPLEYASPQQTTSGGRWGWAAYLGASWTWCIGMFLPVLLIRDYGPWAWMIFAVPNIVGAGAMAWVMRSAEMSGRYTVDHASACRLFSFVTIAFQVFFSLWMLPRLLGPVGYVGTAILVQAAFTPVTNDRWQRVGGAVVLAISAALAIGLQRQGGLTWPPLEVISVGDAIGLALVCLAGFIACPYLDLTFHRARQQTSDADAKFAFGIGFGVLFAAMIVLTFFYAYGVTWTEQYGGRYLTGTAMICVALHWLTQMAYTVNLHSTELARQSRARDDAGIMRAGLGAALALGLAVGLAACWASSNWPENSHDFSGWPDNGRAIGELGYRAFMACYGLLFPVYVLLAIGRPRVSWLVWGLVTVAALPFFWLAFIEQRMAWGTAGVGVVVIGSAVGRGRTRIRTSDLASSGVGNR